MRQGNIAVDWSQKNVSSVYMPGVKGKTAAGEKAVAIPSLTLREKLFYIAMIVMFVIVSSSIIYRYSLISQYNYEIQKTNHHIAQMEESNRTLQIKIDELSSRDRIVQIAKNDLGMVENEASVKILSRP